MAESACMPTRSIMHERFHARLASKHRDALGGFHVD
jgi:hypothetical protein